MGLNSGSKVKGKRRNRIKIVLISILFFVLAIIGFGFFYWTTHKDKIIKTELEKAIVKNNNGFYKISYDDMKIDEVAGSLSVHNMKLRFDSARYLSSEKENKVPSMVFDVDIPEINIVGVRTTRALLEKEIVGRKLEIKNPIIDLQYTYRGKDSIRNVPTQEVYRQILGDMDMIQFDSVLITGAQIRTSNRKSGKLIIDVKDVDFSLRDVKVDSAAYMDNTRFLFAKAITVKVAKIAWPSSNRRYDYIAQNISLNSIAGTLSVNQILIRPRLGENAF